MAPDATGPTPPSDEAMAPMAPGPLLRIGQGELEVAVAPAAGGRVAQIRCEGLDWLVGHSPDAPMIGWGSYPMVPWAGRIRHGRFGFGGQHHGLPINLGAHAIHGVGFALPWQVEVHGASELVLSLALPQDERWPFGGTARQRFLVCERRLRMELTVTAGARGMPATVGWHPWFIKPERLEFAPTGCYPRDEEGMACLPVVEPPPGPWDDCFINRRPVVLHRAGQRLQLSSDCDHWVVYDQPDHATCVEPQSGPPDGFNLGLAQVLAPGESFTAWYLLEWL
ncbi:aldose epimerase [Dyella solisilvae]|uniref:Aldose epimerase n=1 Tax=Dyella solisilvae TaxID=1920168 RepID=A0A370K8E0_9GAMM|nr:aldose epimerase [Dyella solisilvae]RDI98904.1 aldose epimerase [Dyella solisilvae]